MNIIYYKLILTSVEDLFHKLCLENFKSFSDHNTLYYLNANYLREDEHLARVITSSNAFSKSEKI
ncbi:hypothetical protein DERP_002793 [Dermatophagoides pteronyssinus]|uniref:Uncharacterized protein n=1 Tax=Dermatophagoides pteronyssinus TaxID=6956 RepID=A0ABQ8JVN5_DERPT|nr:hypothetical protein DERP_002793 [Dermatophagoides pteronyssinus]